MPDVINLQLTLERILSNAVRALDGSAAVIATWDDLAHRYVVNCFSGIGEHELDRLRPLLDEAIPDLAESREQFGLLSRLTPHWSLPVSQQGILQDPVIALPLHSGGTTIGLIYVLRSHDAARFSNLDPPVLSAFADQAAIALQNARLADLLAQEKRRIESILEGSADGIYTVDSRRRIVTLNSAMERLVGRAKEEVIGRPCSIALGLRDERGRSLCPARCPMLTSREDARTVVELEGKIQAQDGRSAEIAVVYSIVRSSEGRPLNAVVNVRDVSKAREMERLRSAFFSMMGHQLQTPLSIIKGYANTLSRTDGQWDENALRQSVRAIEEEADRLSLLVNRLLLASRLESGAMALKREPVHLESLVQKVVRRLEPMTDRHIFSVKFPKDFPPASTDPDLLEEVLLNLVENAIKYSPEGGPISIEGVVVGRQLQVRVIDQGVGVPWWETSRIFERFHRGESQLSQRTRGVGLGLYICDVIMAAHGGQINVVSSPGEGSQFTIVLPADSSMSVGETPL